MNLLRIFIYLSHILVLQSYGMKKK